MRARLYALRFAIALLVAAPYLTAPSCGNDGARQPAGYPCTRDRDCEHTLMCVAGSCRDEPTDASSDAALSDAAPSDAAPSDGAAAD